MEGSKRVRNRVLSAVIALAAAVLMLPAAKVHAEGGEVMMNDKEYATFADALAAINNSVANPTITLLSDITVSNASYRNEKISPTINLNGFRMTVTGKFDCRNEKAEPDGSYRRVWLSFRSDAEGRGTVVVDKDALLDANCSFDKTVDMGIKGGSVFYVNMYQSGTIVTMNGGSIGEIMLDAGTVNLVSGTTKKITVMNEGVTCALNVSGNAKMEELEIYPLGVYKDMNQNICKSYIKITGSPVIDKMAIRFDGLSNLEDETTKPDPCTEITIKGGKYKSKPDVTTFKEQILESWIEREIEYFKESNPDATEEEIETFKAGLNTTEIVESTEQSMEKWVKLTVDPEPHQEEDVWIVGTFTENPIIQPDIVDPTETVSVGDTVTDEITGAVCRITSIDAKKPTVIYEKDSTGAKEVTIPATVQKNGVTYQVTAIKKGAFKKNKNAEKITVGVNVTTIGDNAFANCAKLKQIIIPASVTKLGNNLFKGCKKLKTIIVRTTKLKEKKIAKKAFQGVGKKVTIKVPKKKVKSYKKIFRKRGLAKGVKVKK